MLFRMFGALGRALAIRRLGMIQGEAIAWHHGAEGVRRALEIAHQHPAGSAVETAVQKSTTVAA